MRSNRICVPLAALAVWMVVCPAVAQSTRGYVPARMRAEIDRLDIVRAPAREAVRQWSDATGIPVTVNWEQMELFGVDPDLPVTVRLAQVPAGQALEVIARQLGNPFTEMLVEVSPWDVQLLTKQQANRMAVVRVYDVADLVLQPRNAYRRAPSFDLQDALGDGGNGGDGGGGGGGGSLFGDDDDDDDDDEDRLSTDDHGQSLAEMIRLSIEPDIWVEHGGQYASIRYWNNRLIVRAPMYVHRQIGMPVRSRVTRITPADGARAQRQDDRPTRRSSRGISGTNPPSRVSGVR